MCDTLFMDFIFPYISYLNIIVIFWIQSFKTLLSKSTLCKMSRELILMKTRVMSAFRQQVAASAIFWLKCKLFDYFFFYFKKQYSKRHILFVTFFYNYWHSKWVSHLLDTLYTQKKPSTTVTPNNGNHRI